MKRKSHSRTKQSNTKSVPRLPDLEHAKSAVLNSLTSPDALPVPVARQGRMIEAMGLNGRVLLQLI